jgi:hypothetical protein
MICKLVLSFFFLDSIRFASVQPYIQQVPFPCFLPLLQHQRQRKEKYNPRYCSNPIFINLEKKKESQGRGKRESGWNTRRCTLVLRLISFDPGDRSGLPILGELLPCFSFVKERKCIRLPPKFLKKRRNPSSQKFHWLVFPFCRFISYRPHSFHIPLSKKLVYAAVMARWI